MKANVRSIVFTAIVTTAVALPLGAYAGGGLKGHPHLAGAQSALGTAQSEIAASQQANEKVWGDEGGHARKAKELIDQAKGEVDQAAAWVNSHNK